MTDPFEYDVFLSFSSADEEVVRPIWQELCSNGLRVFWSDATLKKEVGNSWFEIIEKSIERSKHMLLICSENSMNSKWVQREFRAFYDYCYTQNSRRLIPLLTHEFKPSNLPLFLRQLQVGKINDPQFIEEIIPILGGTNIEKLQIEIKSLKEELNLISTENKTLGKELVAKNKKIISMTQQNTEAKELTDRLLNENTVLKEQTSKLHDENDYLKKALEAQDKSLVSENLSLKAQISDLVSNNNVESKKSREKENLLSNENVLLKRQIDNLKRDLNLQSKSTPIVERNMVEDDEEEEGESQNSVGTARILHGFLSLNFICSECGFKVNKNSSKCPRCKRDFI